MPYLAGYGSAAWLPAHALAGAGRLPMLDGRCVNVDALGMQTLVDGALLVERDIDLGACIMHGIDRVLYTR